MPASTSATVAAIERSLEALSTARINSDSYADCFGSIWSLHDETLNIWTHMVAAGFYSITALIHIIRRTTRSEPDSCAILIFLVGAMLCFAFSALYHTFANHSDAGFWQRMDHFGIATFIWAASSAFSIVCFAEHRLTQRLYTTAVTAFALVSFYQLQHDVTHWSEVSRARFTTHALYGALASLPALHSASVVPHRTSSAQQQLLRSFAAFVILNTAGGIIYATGVIEQMTKVRSTSVGTSHQVMHLFAMVGSWVFKQGIHSFYRSTMTSKRGSFDSGSMSARSPCGIVE